MTLLITFYVLAKWASLVAQRVKNLPAMWETQIRSLGQEDPVEKGMAMHSSILAWRIPWTEEPGGLLSMGLQKSLSIHACYLSSKQFARDSVSQRRGWSQWEPLPLLMGSQGWGQGSSENSRNSSFSKELPSEELQGYQCCLPHFPTSLFAHCTEKGRQVK